MKSIQTGSSENTALVSNLVDLLNKGNAHVSLDDALKDIPFDLLGKKPRSLPYSLWQIAEHIRIAQSDILEFSRDASYQSPAWPEGYWPKETKPASEEEWKKCLNRIKKDRKEFIKLLQNSAAELFTVFEHGDGQTLLREALVLADHNSYHTGEIIVLRRLLDNWPK
ncbi:MAG: DinB family protein [Ginsengibacter sp.]